MSEIYFPSCNFTRASLEASKRIKEYLAKKLTVVGCCRVDNSKHAGSKAIYVCQACRQNLESEKGGSFETENLFVYLDRDPDFPWPDYSGLTVTVQDCWRDVDHPEIHEAVRNALKKMNIAIVEMEENREKSTFCGDLHIENRKPESLALLEEYPGKTLRQLPQEVLGRLVLEQTEKYPCPLVAADCNSCIRGLKAAKLAGWAGEGVHVLELATGVYVK